MISFTSRVKLHLSDILSLMSVVNFMMVVSVFRAHSKDLPCEVESYKRSNSLQWIR